jgi:cyclopropane fatty-acyl-phospholipid synthase-like methyltransferase
MKESLFRGTEKDFTAQLDLMKQLVPAQAHVLDYGCSWGYGSFQLSAAGYNTVGFDISKPRLTFAHRQLGIDTIDEVSRLDSCRDRFDAIFVCHVLEHLPSLRGTFDRFRRLLKQGGLLLLFVPNCAGEKAQRLGVNWGPMCCEKHPLAFERRFFMDNLPPLGFQIAAFSEPYPDGTLIREGLQQQAGYHCDGDELVVCAWKV